MNYMHPYKKNASGNGKKKPVKKAIMIFITIEAFLPNFV